MRRIGGILLVAALPACAGGAPDRSGSADGAEARAVTVVLSLSGEAAGPIWVYESDAESQPRWVAVRGPEPEGERVFLREQCAVPECEGDRGVCGMALPVVRRLAPGDSITLSWDGRNSRIRTEGLCEVREELPPGSYEVEFCWTAVEPDPSSDPIQGPSLTGVICGTRTVEMPGARRIAWIVE
jgi:hypothetical protein